MADITYNIPLGFTGLTNTLDLANEYGKNNSFTVIGNEENNKIAANIYGDSRLDKLQGEGGDDSLSASAFNSTFALVIADGGTGTDYFNSIDPLDPSEHLFTRSDSATYLSITGEDGSILDVSIIDTIEYIVLIDSTSQEYFYLTEDLASGRVRAVSLQEVLSRSYGENADWWFKNIDTYSWYHVNSAVTTVLSDLQGNLTLTGNQEINGTGNDLDNRLTGNSATNYLIGRGGDDEMYGNEGDDGFSGGDNDDFMDGGSGGEDVAFYRGNAHEYDFQFLENGYLLVVDRVSDRDGIDTIVNIEFLVFNDQSVQVSYANRDLTSSPSSIQLSSSSFEENITAGSVIASLSSTDDDSGDSYTYSLVAGNGSADNGSFEIVGNQLKIKKSPDFESKNSYSIRLDIQDSGGFFTFEKAFTLSVLDVNEDPSDLLISNSSFAENISAGSVVATLSSSDEDSGDSQTYSLVSGNGSADNGSFEVIGNQLKIKKSPDFESKSSYNIRLETKDSGGLSFQKAFTLSVNDLQNETVRSMISRQLRGNEKNLILIGNKAINGTGNGLKNRITGNSGKNLLDGKGDADVMIGGKGNDTYVVNHSKDRVIEKARGGIDTIRSSVSQTLSANVENLILTGSRTIRGIGNNSKNRITGNSGKNILDGKNSADFIVGGKGNDTIIGGRARDILTGSTGADTFVYRSIRESGVGRAKRDVITDFNGESNDKVDLSAIDAFTKKRGNQAFTFIGSNGFSGNRGEVRFSGGVLQVNTGTDKRADMEIDLTGVTDFSADFLIL